MKQPVPSLHRMASLPLLLQGEHPEILAGIGVGYGKVAFGVQKLYYIFIMNSYMKYNR